MITPKTIVRFLAFRRDAIHEIATNRASLLIGGFLVLSAGFAREYDGEYLVDEPWHLLLPLAASLIGCTAMVILVALVARCRGVREANWLKTFLSFLRVYWMTAPLAWFYAIPVERWMSPGDATRANLWLLGLVAVWRVSLMVRCTQVFYNARPLAAFVPIILFSDILTLLALRFVPGPIFMIMGGVRLSESEDVILGMRLLLSFFGVVSLPVWLITYGVICTGNKDWKWFQADHQSELRPNGASITTWIAVMASLLIWIPILPRTQREQALRSHAESLIRAENFAALAELTRSYPRNAFPPHWDPPPRIGYGERHPHLYSVLAGLRTHDGPAWIRDDYTKRFTAEVRSRRHFWVELNDYTDEEFDQYIDVIANLDDSRELADNLTAFANFELSQAELSDRRRSTLQRILKLAEPTEPIEPARRSEN